MGLHTVEHRHLDYDKAASAIFTEPEIADVGLARPRRRRAEDPRDGGPFSVTPKALINNDARGREDRVRSDDRRGPRGSIVGRHAAELISMLALAVTAGLRVSDLVESLLVHPTLSEALAEAAE
jgi:dihydrolipoamide dehydrogenase